MVSNRDDDEKLLLKSGTPLKSYKIVDGTAISFFKLEDYLKYKESPLEEINLVKTMDG